MRKESIFIVLLFFIGVLTGCATTTPLMTAAEQGDIRAVGDLLAKGIDINERASYGWTPLMFAAKGGHTGIVKLLISKGADVNAKNVYGSTALKYAAEHGHTEIVKQLLLYESADLNSALRSAAGSGHAEIVKLLLDKGADVHATDGADWTPLRHAARKGHCR